MADQTQRLEIATVKAEVGSNILYRFSNDPLNADQIPTESGSIPNLMQVIDQIEESAEAATLRGELAQADGDTLVNTRAGRTQRQKNDEHVSVADYGAVGAGDETVIFNNTALAAGGREILIPFPNFTINAAANAQGCIVRGQNTVMDGVPRNCSGMVGISIRGFRQDQMNNYLPESGTKSPMLVRRANDSAYFVATRKPGRKNGYVVFQLLKDLATDTNSLGGNQQFLRCGFVHNCTGVYATRLQNASVTVGTWTGYNVPASVLGHGSDDAWSPLAIRQSVSADAALTFSVTVPRSGKITLGILGSSGSPASVELSVDGVVQKTVNPQGWTGVINTITLEAVPGVRNIRIRNASGAGTLYFAGINYHRLDEVDAELSYDTLAMYRNASLPFYVKNQGAHDYAIWDYTAAKYGGSYHGGETMISRNLIVSGSSLSMTDGQLVAADDFYIQQQTQIDWSTQAPAGGIIRVDSLLTFREGQCTLDAALKSVGEVPSVIRHLHTGMNGVNDDISQLIFPRYEAVGENTYLGQTSKVVLQHPGTKALAITDFNLYSGIESREGGAFINQTVGSYNKVYYAYVYEGRRPMTDLAFTCRRTFR